MEAKTTKQEKTTIEVKAGNHLAFAGDMRTNLISSYDVCDIVSDFFKSAFADYHGCNIFVNDGRATFPVVRDYVPMGKIYVELYFKYTGTNSEDLIPNLVRMGQTHTSENKSLGDSFQFVCQANSGASTGRMFNVTKETKEALEEFMFNNPGTFNINWNYFIQEIGSPMAIVGSKEEVYVCITGLSLDKILTKIYGAKTEEGEFEYITTPATIIPSNVREFIMQVTRLDLATVRRLQRQLGVYSGNVPTFHVSR